MNNIKFNNFPSSLVRLLNSKTVTGKSGKIFNVGHSTLNNLFVINSLFNQGKPLRTMEIGFLFGASALLFCDAHKKIGRPGERQHIALDPFQEQCWDDAGTQAIENAGLMDWFELKRSYSSIEMPRMFALKNRFGMIYIDGSHIFEDVFIDAYYGVRLLDSGGIILFDDSSDNHVKKVIKFLRKNCAHALRELNLSPFYPSTKASFRHIAARLLGKSQLTAFQLIGNIERPWDVKFSNF